MKQINVPMDPPLVPATEPGTWGFAASAKDVLVVAGYAALTVALAPALVGLEILYLAGGFHSTEGTRAAGVASAAKQMPRRSCGGGCGDGSPSARPCLRQAHG